jgi:hypothetical protein
MGKKPEESGGMPAARAAGEESNKKDLDSDYEMDVVFQ